MTIHTIESDFFKNKEFDEEKAKEFPNGFLYFPYLLDVDTIDESREAEYKEMIKKIMFYLWLEECQLVVSSDFENELPHNGYALEKLKEAEADDDGARVDAVDFLTQMINELVH